MNQQIINGINSYKELKTILKKINCHKFLLVCDTSFSYLNLDSYLNSLSIPYVIFNEFIPNPLYENVIDGIKKFYDNECDTIVAIGGGSSIDVAKCIKLFCKTDCSNNILNESYFDTKVPLIAIPTTAGTGSESTRYAVIYYDGKKQSITHNSILPNYVILDSSFLKTLPIYQKKCTLLDALCQAIESWWSINSTKESIEYSKIAIQKIIKNIDKYIFQNDEESSNEILIASNYAGKAINITQTTAPHAMSYKLTSLYNLPHGHAVAICLPEVWYYMLNNLDKCIDSRGQKYLQDVFQEISLSLECSKPNEAIDKLRNIIKQFEMNYPISNNKENDCQLLTNSINLTRLKNNPISLDNKAIGILYTYIVKQGG